MKRTPEARQAHLPDVDALKREYKKNKNIVLNIGGGWKMAQIQKKPDFNNPARIRFEVLVDGETKNRHVVLALSDSATESLASLRKDGKLVLVEKPAIVDVSLIGQLSDNSSGGKFEIMSPRLTHNGFVEYDIVMPNGETFSGVPQELIQLWKKTLDIEKKVRNDLTKRVRSTAEDKREELQNKRVAIEKEVQRMIAQLPEVHDMPSASRRAVERIAKRVETLHQQAEQAIIDLEKSLDEHKDTTVPAELNFDHMDRESKVDRKVRIKREKKERVEQKKRATQIEKTIERRKIKLFDAIKIEEATALETLNDERERNWLEDDPRSPLMQWLDNDPQRRGRQPDRKKFDRYKELSRLPKSLALPFEKRRDEVEFRVVFEYYKGLRENAQRSPLQDALFSRIVEKRKERAKHDVDVTGVDDYAQDDDGDSPYVLANANSLSELLNEWKEDYVPDAEPGDANEKIFDYDRELKKVDDQFDAFKEKLAPAGKVPADDSLYKDIYDDFVDAKAAYQTTRKNLETIDLANAYGVKDSKGDPYVFSDIGLLNQYRLGFIKSVLENIQTLEDDYEQVKYDETQKTAKTELKAHQKTLDDAEAEQVEREPIDIPDFELLKILESDPKRVHDMMTGLLQGAIDVDTDGKKIINAELLEHMQDVFGNQPPQAWDQGVLRRFGIKNWDVFKKVWDDKLAERSVHILDDLLKKKLERKIAENTGWFDKFKLFKERIIARGAMNTVLITGSAMTAGHYLSFLGDMAIGASGAASGVAKWATFKTFFGSKKAQERAQQKTQTLHDQKKTRLVNDILKDMFTFDGSGGVNGLSKDTDPIAGVDALSRMMAQGLRDETNQKMAFKNSKGEDFVLEGNDVLTYRRYLESSEIRNLEEKQKVMLAYTIARMSKKGNNMMGMGGGIEPDSSADFFGRHVLPHITGRESLKGAVAVNTALSTLFMSFPGLSAAFGAGMFGYLGNKMGEKAYYDSERKKSHEVVSTRMSYVATQSKKLREGTITPEDKQKLRDEVIALKRMMHGSAPPEEMYALIYMEQQAGKDELGNALPPIVRVNGELLGQMQPLVYEAERAGLFVEKAEEAKIGTVLKKMIAAGDKVQEQQDPRARKKKWKKFGYKAVGSVVGAVVGAAGGYIAAKIVRGSMDALGFNKGVVGGGVVAKGDEFGGGDTPQHHIDSRVGEGESAQGRRPLDTAVSPRGTGLDEGPVDPAIQNSEIEPSVPHTPEIEPPAHTPTGKYDGGEIVTPKGGSKWGNIDKMRDMALPEHVPGEAREEWETLISDKRAFRRWQYNQVRDSGHIRMVHPGAVMKRFWVADGNGGGEWKALFSKDAGHVNEGPPIRHVADTSADQLDKNGNPIEKSEFVDRLSNMHNVAANNPDDHVAVRNVAFINEYIAEHHPNMDSPADVQAFETAFDEYTWGPIVHDSLFTGESATTPARTSDDGYFYENFQAPAEEVVAAARVSAGGPVGSGEPPAVAGVDKPGGEPVPVPVEPQGVEKSPENEGPPETLAPEKTPPANEAPPDVIEAGVKLPSIEAYKAMSPEVKFDTLMTHVTQEWSSRINAMQFDNAEFKAEMIAELNNTLADRGYTTDLQVVLDKSTPQQALAGLEKILVESHELSANMKTLMTNSSSSDTGTYGMTADLFGGETSGMLRYVVDGKSHVIYKPNAYFIENRGYLFLGGSVENLSQTLNIDKGQFSSTTGETMVPIKVIVGDGGGYDIMLDESRLDTSIADT